jgi:hypothetical protein
VKRTSSRVGLSPTEKHRLVTAHRSSPITEPSSLLQAGPSQTNASVLSPRGFLPLCFSLGIDGLVPAVPHKSLCRTHAPYTPAAARPVIRLLAGLSQQTASPLVSTAPDTLTTRLRRVCLRSSFRHSPAPGSCPGLFTRRSPPRLFTAAARAGLRPAPESRSRGARPHLLRSFTTRISFHLLLLPCFCSTHPVDASSLYLGQQRSAVRQDLDAGSK